MDDFLDAGVRHTVAAAVVAVEIETRGKKAVVGVAGTKIGRREVVIDPRCGSCLPRSYRGSDRTGKRSFGLEIVQKKMDQIAGWEQR